MRKNKWTVYGEYGGSFTNLKAACECAKAFSLIEDYKDDEICVWLIEEGSWYIAYKNGKKVFDGWKK